MKTVTTQAQIDFIVGNFTTMGNKELQRATGCCLPTIYRITSKYGLKRSEDFRKILCGKKELTDKELDWLVKKFGNTDNWELADQLGISESTLHRLARRFGLKKSKAFMRRCQQESAKAAKYIRDKYGLNEAQRGVYSENLQKGKKYQFKAGLNNRQRNGEENERNRIISSTITRRETIRRERLRIKAGLPQKTKLKLKVV
ncbi:MAG: hypothetical protein ACI4TM_06720 [Candidatus Cryptobacteroides sp.]